MERRIFMKRTYPDYYDDFKCIADKCPKTCCAGWQIEIDEDSIEKYRRKKIETVDFKHECFFQDKEKRSQQRCHCLQALGHA